MKICKCGFETTNEDYEYCPKCTCKLELFTGKRSYLVGISAENEFLTEIEMTYDEALIIDRFLTELNNKNNIHYSGHCWIVIN